MGYGIGRVACGTAVMLCLNLSCVLAQQPQQPSAQPNAPAAQPGQTAPGPGLPDTYKLNLMIRTAIIALNQANQTGNYTVLRDLGAATFRAANDASRLAEIFSGLRKRQLDLSPIIFFTPKIVQQPQIDQRGLLRLVGYFPTTPEQVSFDIYYLLEAGNWRLFGIGVMTTPAETTAAMPAQTTPVPQNQKNATGQPSAPKGVQPQAGAKSPGTGVKAAAKPEAPARAAGGQAPRSAPPKPDAQSAVQNKTINDRARINLSNPAAPAPEGAQNGAVTAPKQKAEESESFFPW